MTCKAAKGGSWRYNADVDPGELADDDNVMEESMNESEMESEGERNDGHI